MKDPNGRLSGDGSAQARSHGGIRGELPPNLFCVAPNFVVLRKICFKHMIKTKIFFWWRQLAAGRSLICAFCQGGSGERSCARSFAAIHSVAVDRTPNLPIERLGGSNTQPSNWEADTFTVELFADPTKIFPP